MMTTTHGPARFVSSGPWEAEAPGALRWQLVVYFVSIYVITWGSAAVLLMQPDFLVHRFGPVDVATPFYAGVFFVSVWVPSVTGFVLTYKYTGRTGMRELVSRILRWRVGPIGWVIVLGIPLFYVATDWLLYAVFHWSRGAPNYKQYVVGWITAFFSGAILLDPGPLGEEVGWRGFAFPRMLSIMPFWKAELILGVIWGCWHVPAFFIASTGQSSLHMGWFILGAIALSFLMGSAYVCARGSVLYAGFVIHYFANQLPDLERNIQFEVLRFALMALCLTGVARLLRGRRRAEALNSVQRDSMIPATVSGRVTRPRRNNG